MPLRQLSAFFIIFLALSFQVTHAAPAYLDCTVAGDSEQKKFSVKLDESSGQITHTSEKGGAFNAKGFFAAKTISYQNVSIMGGSLKVTFQYTIDRTTLKVREAFIAEPTDPRLLEKVPAETRTMEGSCSVVSVSGRKI